MRSTARSVADGAVGAVCDARPMAVVDDPVLHAELTDPLMREGLFADGDPFPHYARLRREAPVAWNEAHRLLGPQPPRRRDRGLEDPERFCSGKGILTFEIGVEYPTPADDDAHRPAGAHRATASSCSPASGPR